MSEVRLVVGFVAVLAAVAVLCGVSEPVRLWAELWITVALVLAGVAWIGTYVLIETTRQRREFRDEKRAAEKAHAEQAVTK